LDVVSLWRIMVRTSNLRLKRSRVRAPAVPLSDNNLGQVVHTHVPLSPSSKFGTGQLAVMSCSWGGNRRSGVALAMRHRLLWFIHLRAHGLKKGDEHPAYTPHGVLHTLLFTTFWFGGVLYWGAVDRTPAPRATARYTLR